MTENTGDVTEGAYGPDGPAGVDDTGTEGLTEIRVDRFFPHPPAKVWRVLTEPELIGRWLMPGDFRLEVGHV